MKRAKINSAKRNGVKPKIPSTGAIVRHWIQSDPCKQGDFDTAAILLSELYRANPDHKDAAPLIEAAKMFELRPGSWSCYSIFWDLFPVVMEDGHSHARLFASRLACEFLELRPYENLRVTTQGESPWEYITRDLIERSCLFPLLNDPCLEVRRCVAEIVRFRKWEPQTDREKALLALVRLDWAALEALGDAAIDPLIQSLHFNTALSGLIIQTLDKLHPGWRRNRIAKAALCIWTARLADPRTDIQQGAISALGVLGTADAMAVMASVVMKNGSQAPLAYFELELHGKQISRVAKVKQIVHRKARAAAPLAWPAMRLLRLIEPRPEKFRAYEHTVAVELSALRRRYNCRSLDRLRLMGAFIPGGPAVEYLLSYLSSRKDRYFGPDHGFMKEGLAALSELPLGWQEHADARSAFVSLANSMSRKWEHMRLDLMFSLSPLKAAALCLEGLGRWISTQNLCADWFPTENPDSDSFEPCDWEYYRDKANHYMGDFQLDAVVPNWRGFPEAVRLRWVLEKAAADPRTNKRNLSVLADWLAGLDPLAVFLNPVVGISESVHFCESRLSGRLVAAARPALAVLATRYPRTLAWRLAKLSNRIDSSRNLKSRPQVVGTTASENSFQLGQFLDACCAQAGRDLVPMWSFRLPTAVGDSLRALLSEGGPLYPNELTAGDSLEPALNRDGVSPLDCLRVGALRFLLSDCLETSSSFSEHFVQVHLGHLRHQLRASGSAIRSHALSSLLLLRAWDTPAHFVEEIAGMVDSFLGLPVGERNKDIGLPAAPLPGWPDLPFVEALGSQLLHACLGEGGGVVRYEIARILDETCPDWRSRSWAKNSFSRTIADALNLGTAGDLDKCEKMTWALLRPLTELRWSPEFAAEDAMSAIAALVGAPATDYSDGNVIALLAHLQITWRGPEDAEHLGKMLEPRLRCGCPHTLELLLKAGTPSLRQSLTKLAKAGASACAFALLHLDSDGESDSSLRLISRNWEMSAIRAFQVNAQDDRSREMGKPMRSAAKVLRLLKCSQPKWIALLGRLAVQRLDDDDRGYAPLGEILKALMSFDRTIGTTFCAFWHGHDLPGRRYWPGGSPFYSSHTALGVMFEWRLDHALEAGASKLPEFAFNYTVADLLARGICPETCYPITDAFAACDSLLRLDLPPQTQVAYAAALTSSRSIPVRLRALEALLRLNPESAAVISEIMSVTDRDERVRAYATWINVTSRDA